MKSNVYHFYHTAHSGIPSNRSNGSILCSAFSAPLPTALFNSVSAASASSAALLSPVPFLSICCVLDVPYLSE